MNTFGTTHEPTNSGWHALTTLIVCVLATLRKLRYSDGLTQNKRAATYPTVPKSRSTSATTKDHILHDSKHRPIGANSSSGLFTSNRKALLRIAPRQQQKKYKICQIIDELPSRTREAQEMAVNAIKETTRTVTATTTKAVKVVVVTATTGMAVAA